MVDVEIKDLKKALGGNVPKVVFVCGGPASGKGTQCARLVEEFGYTHLSLGDLMRLEAEKPTKEGERLKKTMADGGLVPTEQTVAILVNGMIASPSPAYLIDGFPRSTDQALYFEQNVLECQKILHFEVTEQVMFERCQKRAESSGRTDDNPETMKKRVANYKETSEPVVEYYERFGKVVTIDSNGTDINAIYAQARVAVLPQLFFSMGPPASAQDVVAANVTQRSNMRHLKWPDYLAENGLAEASDDDKILRLIDDLSNEKTSRVFLEQFPENLYQAKFFIRNCKAPSHVFNMNCSQDVCQERMMELGPNSPGYLSSGILA